MCTCVEIDRFAFRRSIDRAWPTRRASCWRWHRATHSSATAFPLGQAPPRANSRPRPAPLWLVSGRSRRPLPPQPPTLSPPHPQPHPNPPLGARGERDAVRLPRDIRGPEVVYGTHVDHFDRAPRQLTPLPSLLQARARCCAARVGKLVVDKAFAVDFPAERGQDGLRGGWAATGRRSGRQPTRHHLAAPPRWTAGTARDDAPELPAGCEDGSASMASALLPFAYRHSALHRSRPLALPGAGGDTLPGIPAPAPQMQRQDCPRPASSSP